MRTYLTDSIGLCGTNLKKLAAMAAVLAVILGPWIIVGDWNGEPHMLAKSKWLEQIQIYIVTAMDTHYTSTAADGKMYDFAVMNKPAHWVLKSCTTDHTGPWTAYW